MEIKKGRHLTVWHAIGSILAILLGAVRDGKVADLIAGPTRITGACREPWGAGGLLPIGKSRTKVLAALSRGGVADDAFASGTAAIGAMLLNPRTTLCDRATTGRIYSALAGSPSVDEIGKRRVP